MTPLSLGHLPQGGELRFESLIISSRINGLRELQSASGEELRPLFGRTLMPSVLDRAFKEEL